MLYPPFYIFPREFLKIFLRKTRGNSFYIFPREFFNFFRNNFEILVEKFPLKKWSLNHRKVTLNFLYKMLKS